MKVLTKIVFSLEDDDPDSAIEELSVGRAGRDPSLSPSDAQNGIRVAQAGGFQMNIGALGRTKPGSAAILLSVVLLSACSTGAQQQAAQIQQTETQTGVGVRDCIDGVMAKPDYAHLKTKMFVSSDATATPPLEYLSDNSHPTKSEIADIYKYYSDIRPCRKIALEGEATVHPARVNALVTGYDATDKLAVEFVSGRMTWGNFNQQRASI